MSTRLETIVHQTTFLLDKHRTTREECEQLFDGFLEDIKRKSIEAKARGDEKDARSFDLAFEVISRHADQFTEEAMEDIDFLEKQLESMSQVRSLGDQDKEEQLADILLDGDEVLDTAEFEKGVTNDCVSCSRGVESMIDNFETVLDEEGPQALALLLEAMDDAENTRREEEAASVDSESDDEQHYCKSDDQSCCGGVDIFSTLSEHGAVEAESKEMAMGCQGGACSPDKCKCGGNPGSSPCGCEKGEPCKCGGSCGCGGKKEECVCPPGECKCEASGDEE